MSHTCLCLPSRSWYSFTDLQPPDCKSGTPLAHHFTVNLTTFDGKSHGVERASNRSRIVVATTALEHCPSRSAGTAADAVDCTSATDWVNELLHQCSCADVLARLRRSRSRCITSLDGQRHDHQHGVWSAWPDHFISSIIRIMIRIAPKVTLALPISCRSSENDVHHKLPVSGAQFMATLADLRSGSLST